MNRLRIDEEIKLYEYGKERDRLELLADLYAIIRTTEGLEAAYSRDAVSAPEYADSCFRLISQFKTSEAALVACGAIVSAEDFFREYHVECPRAYQRLIKDGLPATVLHASRDQRGELVAVAETVDYFISAMDYLKLNQRAVDSILPAIMRLVTSLRKVEGLPQDFIGLVRLDPWLKKLDNMKAHEEISEEEERQLLLELDNAYAAFHAEISKKSTTQGSFAERAPREMRK
jgi:ESCRT-I complex subunit VPS28